DRAYPDLAGGAALDGGFAMHDCSALFAQPQVGGLGATTTEVDRLSIEAHLGALHVAETHLHGTGAVRSRLSPSRLSCATCTLPVASVTCTQQSAMKLICRRPSPDASSTAATSGSSGSAAGASPSAVACSAWGMASSRAIGTWAACPAWSSGSA